MTSHAHNVPTRDSPIERRTTSSSNQRHSIDSNETGESSTAANNRNSFATSTLNEDDRQHEDLTTSLNENAKKNGRGNHRPHNKGRGGGGFLLSNSLFQRSADSSQSGEHMPRTRSLTSDPKGKSTDKKHNKRQPESRAGSGSPLASNVISAPTAQEDLESGDREPEEHTHASNTAEGPARTVGLDVDSAQIVNLALNLSESRRIASRRNVSTPLPSMITGLGDGVVGGSLRQHLQQQRRVSRNVSPKPDRNEKALSHTPRAPSGLRAGPLHGALDTPDSAYQYHFSSSTLARAEKAKKAIELMAQYRRLLQFLPPLKSESTDKPRGNSVDEQAPGSSGSTRSGPTSEQPQRVFGRQYNPLQYIRNRKVRARARVAIDGEVQGFGNVQKVSSWVDEVSKSALNDNFVGGYQVALPPFSKSLEDVAHTNTSPQSAGSKGQTPSKLARPRIDWAINPADMLADIYWVEQGDNKTLIEDRTGRPLIPRTTRKIDNLEPRKSSDRPRHNKPDSSLDLRIDTKLPNFRSPNHVPETHPDSATSKMRHKLHEAHGQYGSNAANHERSRFLRSRSRSSSDSSESDHMRHLSRRRRSGTMESQDHERDILEKQMLEMLAKETGKTDCMKSNRLDKQNTKSSIETSIPTSGDKSDSSMSTHRKVGPRTSRKESPIRRKHIFQSTPSGRPSLEVPGMSPRNSLEGLDSTAPNSPQTKASRLANAFVPSIALDLSSPRSRRSSPNRKRGLSRVRSKINLFRDHSRERVDERDQLEGSRVSIDSIESRLEYMPDILNGRGRSISPTKKLTTRATDESSKSLKKETSLRKSKGEESSGIRGLFKGNRGPVARVSDFLWKKDSNTSVPSTDESDVEDDRMPVKRGEKRPPIERQDTEAMDAELSPNKPIPTYINNMPSFKSPLDQRGRPTQARKAEAVRESEALDAGKSSKITLEPQPRINIQTASPASSPVLTSTVRRDSDVSDVSTGRGTYARGVRSADARLNAILGYPGHKRDVLPVTGLSIVEANHDKRPSLDGRRQWSISDNGVSIHRGPMTQREIARIRALLLSSGIKANELSRRSEEPVDIRAADGKCYDGIALFTDGPLALVPRSQQHILAAKILRNDIQLSTHLWQQSAEAFSMITIRNLLNDMGVLQGRLVENLTPMTRKAADEADEVSKDLVTRQMLEVNKLTDSMDKMMRRRRRRFRWVRRGGWVMVEWALVGVMWWVWFMVVFCRVVMGIGKGAVGAVKWLFWL